MKADREAKARAEDPNGLTESELEELRRLRKENVELRTDRGDPPQGGRLFRPGDDAVSRFRFVDDHRDTYEVKRLCAPGRSVAVGLLRVAEPAGRRPGRSPTGSCSRRSARSISESRWHLRARPGLHGPAAPSWLVRVGCKRVARLMRAERLVGCRTAAQVAAGRTARHRTGPGPARPRLHGRAAEPAVGGRHHRVPHRRRQALRRRRPGPLPPRPGRLGHGRPP